MVRLFWLVLSLLLLLFKKHPGEVRIILIFNDNVLRGLGFFFVEKVIVK